MRNRAFTLVELLAVVGILAVLAAVGYSLLRSTKVQAMAASDTAKLRQIGLARSLYEIDNGPMQWDLTDPLWDRIEPRLFRSEFDSGEGFLNQMRQSAGVPPYDVEFAIRRFPYRFSRFATVSNTRAGFMSPFGRSAGWSGSSNLRRIGGTARTGCCDKIVIFSFATTEA
jgi:prepilin-type N-terminal cleavage/methylation domain-containing protein